MAIEERRGKKRDEKTNEEQKHNKGARKRKNEDRSEKELHKQGEKVHNNKKPNEDGVEREKVKELEERKETKVVSRPGKYTRGRGHNEWRRREGEDKDG